jgi:hypothetical protein
MILFGGTDPVVRNDVWVMPLDGSQPWIPLVVSGPRPPRRHNHAAVFDPVRNRMLVHGGDAGAPRFGDLWELRLSGTPVWQELAPTGTPPSARTNHTVVYDPVRDRLVLFGGDDGGTARDDVWELTLGGTPAWNLLTPTGTPGPRHSHAAIYDPARDRMVVHGGQIDVDNVFGDAWALSLAGPPAWTSLTPGSPWRTGHAAIYDPIGDGMILVGGLTEEGSYTRELLFSPHAWSTITTPSSVPQPSDGGQAAVHDPTRQRMVVHGGKYYDAYRRENETWSLDLATQSWSRQGPDIPGRRSYHTTVYDPATRRMVLYGGTGEEFVGADPPWVLPLGESMTWTPLAPTGTPPPLHIRHAAIFAPSRGSMLVFGPADPQVWELTLGGAPAWSPLPAAGTPTPRAGLSAIHDVARDRMVTFGGEWSNEVWALTLGGSPTWSLITPSGTPPMARNGHSAIYDPVEDRMIVFAGYRQNFTFTNEVWELRFTPSPAWTLLSPAGTPPAARRGAATVYDPLRRRMLVFGGQGTISEFWSLNLDGPPAWTFLLPTGESVFHRGDLAGVFDVAGDRFVFFGGYRENSLGEPFYLNDTWALAFGDALDVPPGVSSGIRLEAGVPNPAGRGATIAFSLAADAHASVRVYDLAGRHVRTLADGTLPAGRHVRRWDLTTDDGDRVRPGLYLYELRSGPERRSKKLIVVE